MKKLLLSSLFVFTVLLHAVFSQCPPPGFPAPGDNCNVAPTLCDDIGSYCATLGSNNVPAAFPGCPSNALNNDEWFGFIAGSTTITVEVIPSNCLGTGGGGATGMQGAMYEGSCSGPAVATQCGCTTTTFNLSYTNFIIGSAYYIVFDGCGGDICDFEVNVIQGSTIPTPPATPGQITGPDQVCPGGTTAYSVPNPNAATYNWTLSPPAMGTVIPGGGTNSTVSVNWNIPGTATLCVTASNPCFSNPTPSCYTVTSTAIPATHVYESICLGDCTVCAGQTFCAATPPAGTPVTLNSWQGCDSVVYCHISTIPAINVNLGAQTFCGPHNFLICGQSHTSSGFYSETCDNWQGCDSTVLVDLAILDPVANISPPAVLSCGAGASVVLTGINSSFPNAPGAQFTFQWTGPGVVPPSNQVTCTVNAPGQYCLTLTHSRNGVSCTDSECVTVTQNNAVPSAPGLTGPQTPCQNSTQTYTVTPVGAVPATGYTWTAPNNVTVTQVTPTTVSINWNSALGGNLCVTANNGCGSSPQTCIPITIGLLPGNPVMTGATAVCSNNTPQTYTVSNPQAGVTYNWTVPAGASFSGSGQSIAVNYSGAAAGTGQVCVTAQNPCGTSQPTCVAVTITPLPMTPAMSGLTAVCSSSANNNYTVSNPQAGVTYNWTAPPGATITGTGASVSVNFNSSTSGQVCVSATNSCGTSIQTCQSVTVTPAPSASISGAGTFCQGTTPNVNLTITLSGTGPWTVGYAINNGATITINVTSSPHTLTATQAGTYSLVSLSTGGGCPGTVSGSATVTQNPSPTATLNGSGSICQGSGTQATLSIVLTGTSPWTVGWAVGGAPQANLNITTSPYNLNIGQAQAGNITLTSVTDGNNCNGTVSGSGTVTVNTAPTVSNIQTPCNGTNTSFTVSFEINGGTTPYSVSPATGNLAGNIFTSNPIPTGSGYSFVVTDGNNCNPVTVTEAAVICDCATSVGTMNIAPLDVCGDGPATPAYDNFGEAFDANDVLVFILHSGGGLSIVPPVLGTFPSSSVTFNPATMAYGTTYYLSAVVGDGNGAGSVLLNDPCLDVAQGTPITFFDIPSATLSGSTEVCEGDPANLTVNFTGEGPWTISYDDGSGALMVNGITDNPYTLVVNPDTTTSYSLTAMSDVHCPGDANGNANVAVNTGVTVNNVDVECNATSTAYTVTFDISGGEPATYIVNGVAGNIVNGVFTSNPIPAGSGFSITVTDANDCDAQAVEQTTVICDCVTEAGDMSDILVEVCGDGPVTVDVATGFELDADDLLKYVLHELNSSIIGGIAIVNDAPTFSFNTTLMSYGTTYYISSVVGSEHQGTTGEINLSDPCLSIAPGTPVVFYEVPIASLAGTQEICPGEDATLMINLTGDSPWEATINGQLVSGIVGTPFSYTVNPATTTVFNLTAVSDEHCDNVASGTETVTVHVPPTAGAPDVDCNATGTGFTVCFDITGGDPACLDVSPGGNLTGNQFCSNVMPDGQGFSFSVSDCHGCPAVVVQDQIVDCSCLTYAGDMNATPIEICGSGAAVGIYPPNQPLQVLDGDDALCFILHEGDPNQPVATSSTPEFSFNLASMTLETQYFICPIAGNDDGSGCVDLNDPCLHVGGCVPVTFHANPTAQLSGTTNICSGENAGLSVVLTGVAPWSITYQSAAGAPVTVTANVSPFNFNVNPASSTVYDLVSISDANCDGTVSGNAIITVNEPPQFANETRVCDPTGTSYVVMFDVLGGDVASYSVNPPGNLTGGVFTSNPIPSGTPYTFSVDDANGCGPTVISGTKNCDCLTDAGDMVNLPGSFCVNEPGTVTPTTGEVFDANDVLIYVLHTNAGAGLGTVIATSSTPSFNFNDVTMDAGVQYYISAVAGDNNGSGGVDLTDDCLSVAAGTPIIYLELPTATVSGTTTICEGQDASFTINLTGTGPFELTYLLNGVTNTQPVPVNTITINQPWLNTTSVTLVSILDLASGCVNTSTQTATIIVNPSVEAGNSLGNFDFCQNEASTISLANQISGGDSGGQWTGPGGISVNGNSLDASLLAVGTNTFTYTVDGIAPCPDDQVTVDVVINPAPVADAGGDKVINCDILEASLGGAGTSAGATYQWSPDTVLDPNAAQTTTTTPGTYTLLVTGAGQCTDSDEIVIEELVTVPNPHISISDVSCFGREDGYIVVDSIIGGQAPYLCSFDGSAFVAQKQFLNLAAGEHSLIIVDDGGCQTTVNFTVAEPEEVTVQLQGSFEGNDPVVEYNTPLTIEVITNPPFEQLDTIFWTPDTLFDCLMCPSNEVLLLEETTFSIVVEKDGCRDDDELTVFVKKTRPVYVPNAFSPNEDGTNERLVVFGGKTVSKIKSFLIFNRWGETVYEYYNFDPNDQTIGWDGKYRGEFMNPAVFTWFAEIEFVDGLVDLLEGNVTLIR